MGIVSTGDELKSPGEPLKHGEIYESNSFGLAGLVEWSGHEPVRYPAVADTMGALRATLNEASADCDLILTSGGVSMGEFDYVRRIMEEEGDIHFWRMKIRPGSPSAVRSVELHAVVWPAREPRFQPRGVSDVGRPLPPTCSGDRRSERVDRSGKIVRRCEVNQRLRDASPRDLNLHRRRHDGPSTSPSRVRKFGESCQRERVDFLQPGQSGDVGEWIDVLVL